ncbi:MAG: GTPase ObgE [Oscillospiraceae bacterium]|jgi:GTP-binding protein|nr:GTPase ObgE [Oscillospiraceae bacterium]MCI1991431.1 GTPase ObgE [Oscillospiraceae bacterium]MCI2035845.1 GTPase ObgE [Oscillospiraceae bacterium]
MFIDSAKIRIIAGKGGDGAVAFHREKYVASGGPDGGDGGRGGNVIFQVDDNLSTLSDFRYRRKFAARPGENGRGKKCNGKSGEDLVIRVPRGTLLKDTATGRLVADLSSDEPQVVAKGGRGGWGNAHFATSTRQTPRFAKPGAEGESLELRLELKLLADVGVVGYPNVGKSTLVSVVSEAKPEIADYHFTTLTPILGVVRFAPDRSFVMADIPGLIEGANEGAGLGHQFLRHVERCRLLVHLVDVSGSEGRDPKSDFRIINSELKKFNPELSERPMLVAGNKCDLASDKQIADFRKYVEGQGFEFFPIMAAIRYQVDPLLNRIGELLSKLPPIKRYRPEPAPEKSAEEPEKNEVTIRNENGVYTVEGEWLERTMRSINFGDEDSRRYFENVLEKTGVIGALRDAGIREGSTVRIYGLEFDFME